MKKRSLVLACAIPVLVACGGEGGAGAQGGAQAGAASRDEPASPGIALLFADGAAGLDEAAQALILSQIGVVLDSAGTGFVDTVCGQPAAARAETLDLNGDGTPEVRVVFGNTCTSGGAGSSVALFIERDRRWAMNLGFPAASAEPMATSNLGWPDLLIGGPGFCFPVWRWNGTEYVHDRQEPQEPGGCTSG